MSESEGSMARKAEKKRRHGGSAGLSSWSTIVEFSKVSRSWFQEGLGLTLCLFCLCRFRILSPRIKKTIEDLLSFELNGPRPVMQGSLTFISQKYA